MDEYAPVNSVVEPQIQPDSKSNTKLLLLGGLGVAIVAIIILTFYYFSSSGNKKAYYQNDAFNRYREGNYEKSQALAKEGLAKYPDDPALLRIALDSSSSLANSRGTEKQTHEQNKELIQKAIDRGSNDPNVMLAVGYSYETAGRYTDALKYYEKAIALKETADAYFHKGHVLEFLNQPTESKASYDKALALDPANPQVGLIIARNLHSNNKDVEALELLSTISNNEQLGKTIRAEALTDAAIIHLDNSERNKAQELSRQAILIDKTYSPALGIYGFLIVKNANDYKTGRNYILNAIQQNERISINYLFAGELLRSVEYFPQAVEYQKLGIAKVQDDNTLVDDSAKKQMLSKMYLELGETYSLANDPTSALAYLKQSQTENPTNSNVIKQSFETGYFKQIKDNPEFRIFINSL
jgi:tetratricopeptide (TPR) repeat protein